MTLPGHGGLTLTPDRRFVYTPDAAFVGPDSFTYTIKDEQGASSTGLVTVDVARQNSPPVAAADNVTSAGQPVVIDPLANDNDPDGDPLRLAALTLPIEGRIAPNPDGTVTYTPPAGFTGQDGFTYQVSDGTVVSEGQVTVSVTAPAVPTYANGFRHRRRIVVPAQATAPETATDFVLLVRESGNWLKPVAAGGRVQHAQAFDLRFELENGTKLDHEVERYDAATGSLIAWVRVPSWDLSSQLRLVLYYGKPGLTGTEANPTAVWRGYLAVLDARTGGDRSGNNRALTPTGIGAGTLLGDAGNYSGTSVASRADATFLSGLNALTVQALVRPDAAMVGSSHGILAQGPMNGSDTAAGVTLQYLATTTDSSRNVIHFKLACSDGGAFVLSGAEAQRAQRQLLHGVWRQGDTARLFLDGVELQPSSASVARSGVTAMPAGGLYLGAGARDPVTGGWGGLIDEVRFAATALSQARIATEARNRGATQGLYGLGGEDAAGQPDAAPVAVPLAVQTTAGSSIDIDVAARAYDPDGPGLPEVAAAEAATNGVVTVVSGKVRYTPFAGYIGADQFSYTLDNAGKRSVSTVFVTAAAPTEMPEALRTITVTSASQLSAALAGNFAGLATLPAGSSGPLRPGDHIACAAGTYAGTFAMTIAGTRANPILIRRAAGASTVTFTGQVAMRGAWCGVHGLCFTGNARKVDISAIGGRVSCCLFDGVANDGMIYLTGSGHPEVRIDRNEFRNITGSAVRSEINNGLDHQNMRIDHNYFNGHQPSGGNETVIQILTDAFRDAFVSYDHNLFSNCMRNNTTGQNELISIKTAAPRVRNNTVVNCNGGFVSMRETNRGIVEGNWFENGSYINLHGDDHVIRNNRSTGKVAEINAGNAYATDALPAQCTSFGKAGRTTIVFEGDCRPAHCACRNAVAENNIGSIVIGDSAGAGSQERALNTTLTNNDRAATRVSGGWTNITETGIGNHVNTAVKLTVADVGPDAP